MTADYSMTVEGLGELVRMLQAHTPLVELSNKEARAVFELMQQRGYRSRRRPTDEQAAPDHHA
jgi:hypothetical protein